MTDPSSIPPRAVSRLGAFGATLRRYVGVIGWIVRDGVWRYKKAAAMALAADFLGVTCQVGAIGQIVYYAQGLAKGTTIQVLGEGYAVRESVPLLILFGAGVFVALTVSGGMIYFSNTTILRVWRDYAGFCANRVFLLVAQRRSLAWTAGRIASDRDVQYLASRDARFCSFALRVMLNAAIPTLTFLVAFATLVHLNLVLSLLLGVLVVAALPFIYRASESGALSSTAFEEYGEQVRKEQASMLRGLRGVAIPAGADDRWIRASLESDANRRHLEAFCHRIIVSQRSMVVINMVLAVGLPLILVFFGYQAIRTGAEWGVVLTYVVAVRYCVTNLRTTGTMLTNLNRFYPQIRRYRDFVTALSAPSEPAPPPPASWPLEVETAGITDSMPTCEFRPGRRVHLLAPGPLNRYTLPFLADCLLSPGDDGLEAVLEHAYFASARFFWPPVSVRGFLRLGPDEDLDALPVEALLRERLRAALPADLDKPVDEAAWEKTDPGTRFELAVLAAVRSECPWVFLDAQGLSALDPHTREHLLAQLNDRFVVAVSSGETETLGCFGEDVVAVTDGRRLVGLGSVQWAEQHRSEIDRRLARARQAADVEWVEAEADMEGEEPMDVEL